MHIADNVEVKIRSLVPNTVGYTFEEGTQKIRRVFHNYQERTVPAKEIRTLSFSDGGYDILKNYFQICNEDLAKELGFSVEETPEYGWTVRDVDNVLLEGSDDILLDALDFAPDGIKELILIRAVDLEISDLDRRELISRSTGTNVDQRIKLKQAYESSLEETDNKVKIEKPRQTRRRRVQNTK